MTPDHEDDGTNSRVAANIPTNQKDALVKLAGARSTAYHRVSMAELVREAVGEYLASQDDLPEETRDALDDDLMSNSGGDEE